MEIIPREVAAVLRFHSEYGTWPSNARPEVIKMAQRLRKTAEAMSNPFEEEENQNDFLPN